MLAVPTLWDLRLYGRRQGSSPFRYRQGKAGVRKLRTGSARTETTCRSPADIGHPSLPLACRRPGRVT